MEEEKKTKKILRTKKVEASGLSAFVERPLPSDKEVESFERALGREARNREIDNNLSAIYSDDKGRRTELKPVNSRKRRPVWRAFKRLIFLAILIGLGYFAYNLFLSGSNDVGAVTISVKAPETVEAGEAFSYQIEYHNPSKFSLNNLRLEVQYPDNFLVASSSLPSTSGDYGWDLGSLAPGGNGQLTISGQLINKAESVNVLSARLNYQADQYSTRFKKEGSASTVVSGPGFRVDLDHNASAFVNEDNEMSLVFSDIKDNKLGDFYLTFDLPDETNVAVASGTPVSATTSPSTSSTATSGKMTISKAGGVSWLISGLNPESGRQEIGLEYRMRTKLDNPEIKVRLEKRLPDGQAYVFYEASFRPEVVSSDLNLTLLLGGKKEDGSVGFGSTLNYTLSYDNKGTKSYKDVVLMAVVKGDFVDSNTLSGEGGQRSGDSLIWNKESLPALAEIQPGQSGEIDFSVKLKSFKEADMGKDLRVAAYGQYGVNNQPGRGTSNRSNAINSRINSDLSLVEQVRYFDADNQPVGSGPLPPKVGEKSSFRVYWTVKNNLHELTDLHVTMALPVGVEWDGRQNAGTGSISYDQARREVTWSIGRLPVSVYRADAEFSISITPKESDRDKILVLSPGSTVSGSDTETLAVISDRSEAKTTKLEDDDIAGMNNSGRIQ